MEKGKKGITILIPQKVKGQQSIFVVKQAIMGEVQQLNLCTVEIHPCYLPRHKNLLLTFDVLGLSKTIIKHYVTVHIILCMCITNVT